MMRAAKGHLLAGQLQTAIEVMTTEVRSKPRDVVSRNFLGQLLCLHGDLERADLQFDTIAQQEPNFAPGISLLRQLIRGEQARRQFFNEGRVPEFLRPPPRHLMLHIEASVFLREGAVEKAMELLEQAEELRPHPMGTCGGEAFDDLRDLDDLTACFLEVLTSTGKFYVIPIEGIARLEFRPPERPCDLLWRRAQMVVRDGPDGEVYIPAIYVPTGEVDDSVHLGRTTSWAGGDGAPMRGIGQRCFLVGEKSVPIMQLRDIELTPATA